MYLWVVYVICFYLMSSKAPSGGTKETSRSRSNRLYRTHGWKEQSSIRPGSTKVSSRSGTPLSLLFAEMMPVTSEVMICPFLSNIASISSMMSRYISFWAYFTPVFLQGILRIKETKKRVDKIRN